MVMVISRTNESPLPVELEEEVFVDSAKHRVHAEVEEEHFVDPSQGFHPEQTCKRCLRIFDDGEFNIRRNHRLHVCLKSLHARTADRAAPA